MCWFCDCLFAQRGMWANIHFVYVSLLLTSEFPETIFDAVTQWDSIFFQSCFSNQSLSPSDSLKLSTPCNFCHLVSVNQNHAAVTLTYSSRSSVSSCTFIPRAALVSATDPSAFSASFFLRKDSAPLWLGIWQQWLWQEDESHEITFFFSFSSSALPLMMIKKSRTRVQTKVKKGWLWERSLSSLYPSGTLSVYLAVLTTRHH